jgi:gliding motility-associated-like protein
MVMLRKIKHVMFLLVLCASSAHAQSILGGNITWESLAGDQYDITLNLYLDCYGVATGTSPFPQTVDIAFNADASCTGAAFSASANNTGSEEVSDLCPSELTNSSCNNPSSANLGIKKLTYETTVTLAAGCAWTASYSGMDWSYSFENMNPFFLQDAYIFSTINTAGTAYGLVDILRDPNGDYISYFCAGSVETHLLNIDLPAGYSATYTFDEQYTSGTGGNAPIPVIGGFTLPAGLTLSPVDASSANVNWTPPALPANSPTQIYTVPINIAITDPGGINVGTIYYSFLIAVRDCNITQTAFDPIPVTSVGTGVTYTDNTGSANDEIEVCAGELLAFTVQASNVNLSRNITITYAFNPPAPELSAITMTQQSLAPGIAYFELQTTSAMASATPYTLTLHAEDDQCPIPTWDDIVLDIIVRPNIQFISTPTVICPAVNFTLEAAGAGSSNDYTWQVQSGGDATPALTQNVAAQTVAPDSTTTYRVSTSLNTGSCSAEDFFTVDVSLHRIQYSIADENCGQLGSIDITPLGTNSANLSYTWTAGSGGSGIILNQEDQSGLEGSLTGVTYDVNVLDAISTCSATGSFTIFETTGPGLILTGTDEVCENTNANLVFDFNGGQAPYDVWIGSAITAAPDLLNVPDLYNYALPITSSTTVTVLQVRDANGCVTDPLTFDVDLDIVARPIVTSLFNTVAPLCVGDPLQLTIDHSEPGTYSVVYSIGGVAQPPLSIADNGVIDVADPTAAATVVYDIQSVSYTDTPACPSANNANLSISVVTHALPTATVPAGLSVSACSPNTASVSLTLTGDGPWDIEYTRNGAAQTTFTIPDSPAIPNYVYNWAIGTSGTYCITQVTDANCTRPVTNQCFDVVINPVPTLISYTINGATSSVQPVDICIDDNINVEVEVSPAGNAYSYVFIGTPDIGIGTYDNESSTFTTTGIAAVDFSLELDRIYFTSTPQCFVPVGEVIDVDVQPEIVVSQTALTCDGAAETYTVQYTITAGTGPFTEAVGGVGGSFLNNIFTTATLTSGGAGGSWTFSDSYDCNDFTVTNTGHTCPIISDAGTMTAGTLTLCSPSTAPAVATATQSTPYIEDDNDVVMFILHTDPLNVLGSEISRSCGNPGFGDADTPLAFGSTSAAGVVVGGVTYYISCVVGNDDLSGCVNLTHPQVQFSSNTQSVVWYESGTATLSAPSGTSGCAGQSVALDIDFTGTGPWNVVYNVGGVTQPAITTAISPYALNVSASGTFTLSSLTSSAGNCPGSVSGSESVVIHPLPTATVSSNALICSGDQHCFDLTFTGQPPFSIDVAIPNTINFSTISGLLQNDQYCVSAAGAYELIRVTDASNCPAQLNLGFNLGTHPTVSASWLSTGDDYCPNELAITAAFSAAGDGPFTIDITGPNPLNPPVIVGNEITITDEGNYTIESITDVHGCSSSPADVFIAVESVVPTADAGTDIFQCSAVPVTIGTPAATGLTYSWTNTAGMGAGQEDDAQPVVTIANLGTAPSISIYAVIVSNGDCTNTDQVIVTIYPNPAFDINFTDDRLCFDAPNNTATLTAANGLPSYTYDWVPTTSIIGPTNGASVTIDPSANEVFEVVASEDFGSVVCTATENISIEVGAPIQITNFVSPTEMCAQSCVNDGEQNITFSVIDAFNNSYTATIDGNPVTDPICYNDPVNHTLLVVDQDNCEAFYNFTINVRNEEVVMAYTPQQAPFCFSDTDGQVPGLNPEANQYTLSQGGQVIDVLNQSPFVFSNLSRGTYFLTMEVLLASGQVCSADTTFALDPDSPEIFIEAIPPAQLGCLNSPVEFNAEADGGAGGFTTYWNSCEDASGCFLGTTNETAGQEFSLILTQDTVVYFYSVDAIGCSSDTISAIGTLSPGVFLLTQNGADTISTCQYDCEELTAFASGGAGALSVEWYRLNDVNDLTPDWIATSDTITECFLFDALYEIRVIDEQCETASISDTLWVTVHDTPEPIMETDGQGGCFPDTVGFSYTYLDPAYTDLSTCIWSLGNGAQINYCGDTAAVYLSPGSFFPSITVTSEFGCVGSDTLLSPITIRPYPEVDFTWDPQPVDVLHRDVHFQNLTAGAVAFEWSFYNAGESFMANPRWTFPDIETVSPYSVCLYATSQYGCVDTLCQDVFVENVLQVFAPNSFTPDGDGLNDVFLPVVNGELNDSYRFWVFNRWGETVFFTEEVGKAWTGGFGDGDYYIQDGYYFWKIEVADLETSKTKTYEGNVFIMR